MHVCTFYFPSGLIGPPWLNMMVILFAASHLKLKHFQPEKSVPVCSDRELMSL